MSLYICFQDQVLLRFPQTFLEFRLYSFAFHLSLSRDEYDRAACDLPAWYFDGLLGNIDVREDLFCVVLWWN